MYSRTDDNNDPSSDADDADTPGLSKRAADAPEPAPTSRAVTDALAKGFNELGVTPGDEPVRGQVTTTADCNLREWAYLDQDLLH
jgi:hypothetical protein